MNIHEYQAKSLLKSYGVTVPQGGVAYTSQEAEQVAKELGGPVWVVKAQIHAGGRGKGGGVKVVKSVEDVHTTAGEILGMQLVTHQTGPEGKEVKRIYIEEGCNNTLGNDITSVDASKNIYQNCLNIGIRQNNLERL